MIIPMDNDVDMDRSDDDDPTPTPAATDIVLAPVNPEIEDVDDDAIPENSPSTVTSGSTLLSPLAARIITTTTKTAQTGIVYSAFAGYYALKASRFATMTSIGLGQAVVDRLITSTGHSVLSDTTSEYSRAEVENLLGWTFVKFHQAATAMQLATAAVFEFTGDSLNAVAGTSLFTLNLINNLLGSTESSKAVAAIIALVHREIQNPTTGADGEQVGYVDLVLGLCGLAYLQRCCRRLSEKENERLQIEETIWDVVVVKEKTVAVQNKRAGKQDGQRQQNSGQHSEIASSPGGIGGHDTTFTQSIMYGPEEQLRREIAESLPAEAKITVSTSTTRTITIEVDSARPSDFTPPPGMVVVEESKVELAGASRTKSGSKYRTVYRMTRSETRSTEQQQRSAEEEQLRIERSGRRLLEAGADYDPSGEVSEAESMDIDEAEGPPVPPKSSSLDHPETIPKTPPKASKTVATQTTPRSSQVTPKASQLPVLQQTTGNAANQKRARSAPTSPPTSKLGDKTHKPTALEKKRSSADLKKDTAARPRTLEKRPSFRSVLRKSTGPTISNLLQKQVPTTTKHRPQVQEMSSSSTKSQKSGQRSSSGATHVPVPDRKSSLALSCEESHPPRGKGLFMFRRSSDGTTDDQEIEDSTWPRRPSHSRIMDDQRSTISTTDAFSVHSLEDHRPASPQMPRDLLRVDNSPFKKPSSSSTSHHGSSSSSGSRALQPLSRHERSSSHDYAPSIYTLKTNDSRMSLALSTFNTPQVPPRRSTPASSFTDPESFFTVKHTGVVRGMFPQSHLIRNISRYMRFSSAVYGSNFLRLMGISTYLPDKIDDIHNEIQTYAHHTGLDTSSILLSSFVDHQGGSNMAGDTGTNVPLVHCISVDTEAKAIVLACRGTLGFEDVLADITCVYDLLPYRGKVYSVHKGFHASARRLADPLGRVISILRAALIRHPDFGLVLTGHSLGGAVTALLGIMLTEPNTAGPDLADSGSAFVTASQSGLPQGRPCHVYAYGPPATMSPALRRATRGLVTSVVHGSDVVPSLSLGTVHDIRAVCVAFQRDNSDAKAEVRNRLWRVFERSLTSRWTTTYTFPPGAPAQSQEERDVDDGWCLAALKTLRASMMNVKLVPPGEVLLVESSEVADNAKSCREAKDEGDKRKGTFVKTGEDITGQSARRVVCRWVRDVEARFGEMRICASMLTDHNPSRYEEAFEGLRLGMGVDE